LHEKFDDWSKKKNYNIHSQQTKNEYTFDEIFLTAYCENRSDFMIFEFSSRLSKLWMLSYKYRLIYF